MGAFKNVKIEMIGPSETDEECPLCRFDSVVRFMVFVSTRPMPEFRWRCVRCRVTLREDADNGR